MSKNMSGNKYKHENIGNFLNNIEQESVFVEIGSDNYEGSTIYLADLAAKFNTVLYTVDINDECKHRDPVYDNEDECWANFYKSIRDESWPISSSFDELPLEIQNECLTLHKWNETKNNFKPRTNGSHRSNYKLSTHPNIIWQTAIGSVWAKNYNSINKKISLLYLDNFDYIWDTNNINDNIQQQKYNYKEKYNIDMNNENCQIEHLKQIIYLFPFLTDNALVALDDTYTHNGCWLGKSGPVVVYLLSNKFKIVHQDKTFVILKKVVDKL